jgi:cation diffusion facilitator family transporter
MDMDACCEFKAEELERLKARHKNVLKTVLTINVVLFVVEITAGILAHSTALLADSLDMLGDSLVYAFSLYVLWRTAAWKAMAAMLKGTIMALFGFGVLAELIYKVIAGVLPNAETMGIVGLLVLIGNAVCFFLLFRYRSDDLNMRSTWLCSRNDIIANVSVLVAAAAVALSGSLWPDVIVGFGIAILFLRTAWIVLVESVREYRAQGLLHLSSLP